MFDEEVLQQIIELYGEGYSDREIRRALNMDVEQYTDAWKEIKNSGLIVTDNIAFYEKAMLRLDRQISMCMRALRSQFIEEEDTETKEITCTLTASGLSLLSYLRTLEFDRINILQKFGQLSPDSVILDIRVRDREALAKMSDKELSELYHKELNTQAS